jgi:SAM-dependent methyltransferase
VDPYRHAQSRSFGSAASAYERGRPPYPKEAVDWLLPPRAWRVLDLGAGTGKLTRQLVERGLEVVAVEPLAEMRAELARAMPGVQILEGIGEAIPLPDGSVDAVLAAQAWHWVDPPRAVPEVARVLRPGGTLGLVWNTRDERVPWVAALTALLADAGEAGPDTGPMDWPTVGTPFGKIELLSVEWSHDLPGDAVLDLVASRSYVILLPEKARIALLARVRELITTQLSAGNQHQVTVPYVTYAFRARLPSESTRRSDGGSQ